METKLCVFLSYASRDRLIVRRLYDQLLAIESLEPCFDDEILLPGGDWEQEVAKAIGSAAVVVVCLSPNAITLANDLHWEITYALKVATKRAGAPPLLIPLKLAECHIPQQLAHWSWINWFEKKGPERLLHLLQEYADLHATQLPPPLASPVVNAPQPATLVTAEAPKATFLGPNKQQTLPKSQGAKPNQFLFLLLLLLAGSIISLIGFAFSVTPAASAWLGSDKSSVSGLLKQPLDNFTTSLVAQTNQTLRILAKQKVSASEAEAFEKGEALLEPTKRPATPLPRKSSTATVAPKLPPTATLIPRSPTVVAILKEKKLPATSYDTPTTTTVPASPTPFPSATALPPSPTHFPSATALPPSPTPFPTATALPPSPTPFPTATALPPSPTPFPTATQVPTQETAPSPLPTNTSEPSPVSLPDTNVGRTEALVLPNLVGYPAEAAKGLLLGLGIKAEQIVFNQQGEAILGPRFNDFPPNTVLSTEPAAGQPLGPSGTVLLFVRGN